MTKIEIFIVYRYNLRRYLLICFDWLSMIFIAGETYKVTRVVRMKKVNSQNYTNPIVLLFKFICFLICLLSFVRLIICMINKKLFY